jgi:hypothetical protein
VRPFRVARHEAKASHYIDAPVEDLANGIFYGNLVA